MAEEGAGSKLTQKLKDKKLLKRDITQKWYKTMCRSTMVIHLVEIKKKKKRQTNLTIMTK